MLHNTLHIKKAITNNFQQAINRFCIIQISCFNIPINIELGAFATINILCYNTFSIIIGGVTLNYLYKNLRKYREINNFTQVDIAYILRIRQEQYSKYELGKREIPVYHLITLSMIYKVSVDELLGINKNTNKEQK